jgi:hypothetical protein
MTTMTDTVAVAEKIVELWAYFAVKTCVYSRPPLDHPGGRDWLQITLVEEFRGRIGGVVVDTLESPDVPLPLTVACLCVHGIIRACNSEFAPIAGRVATAAAAGEGVKEIARAAVAEAEPHLRAAVSLAVERAVLRG